MAATSRLDHMSRRYLQLSHLAGAMLIFPQRGVLGLAASIVTAWLGEAPNRYRWIVSQYGPRHRQRYRRRVFGW